MAVVGRCDDPFDSADLYDACDSETVTHDCPEEAVYEAATWGDWHEDPHPITVRAFVWDDDADIEDGVREVGKRTYSIEEVREILND